MSASVQSGLAGRMSSCITCCCCRYLSLGGVRPGLEVGVNRLVASALGFALLSCSIRLGTGRQPELRVLAIVCQGFVVIPAC